MLAGMQRAGTVTGEWKKGWRGRGSGERRKAEEKGASLFSARALGPPPPSAAGLPGLTATRAGTSAVQPRDWQAGETPGEAQATGRARLPAPMARVLLART